MLHPLWDKNNFGVSVGADIFSITASQGPYYMINHALLIDFFNIFFDT
jgi:hypothetical protein